MSNAGRLFATKSTFYGVSKNEFSVVVQIQKDIHFNFRMTLFTPFQPVAFKCISGYALNISDSLIFIVMSSLRLINALLLIK